MGVGSYGQSNAFSIIEVPLWMRHWLCCPPVRAGGIWCALSPEQRSLFSPEEYIYPSYCRLPMGLSHAVYILMAINVEHAYRILMATRRRLGLVGDDKEAAPTFDGVDD